MSRICTTAFRGMPPGRKWGARRWMVLGLLAVIVGTAVVLIPPSDEQHSSLKALELHWPKGHELVYRLSYSAQQKVALGADRNGKDASSGITGRLVVDAHLVMRDVGSQEHEHRIGCRLEDIKTLDLEIAGGRPLALPEAIEKAFGNKQEAIAVLGANGTLREIRVAPDAPPLFLMVMRQLLQETGFTLDAGGSWTVQERTPHGIARSVYRRVQDAEVERSRQEYVSVDALALVRSKGIPHVHGEARFTFSSAGWLRSLHGVERITGAPSLAVDSQITLELAELRTLSGPQVVRETVGYPPDVEPVTEQDRQSMLEQRVAGRTLDELLGDLQKWGNMDSPPGLAEFLWQATGYLELHPEACRELVPLFLEEGASSKRRARILDLLANVGHAQAQDVMRSLLSSAEAKADKRYVFLFQRLSLLPEPDEKTVELVRHTYETSDGDTRMAAMYALGAVAAGRFKQGDEETARQLDERLRQKLRDARDDTQRLHALRALSSVGFRSDVPVIAAHASSEDSSVRTVVALSLRNLQTPESEQALLDLTTDGIAQVQRAALASLQSYTLTPAHLEALQEKVSSAGISPEAYQELFVLLRDVGAMNQEIVARTARHMLDNGISDPEVRLRVQSLLSPS